MFVTLSALVRFYVTAALYFMSYSTFTYIRCNVRHICSRILIIYIIVHVKYTRDVV